MKKKQGKSFNLYLPEDLVRRVDFEAEDRDRSRSFIVACALRAYFKDGKKLRRAA